MKPGEEAIIEMEFPFQGLYVANDYERQPKGTTPVAVNVRAGTATTSPAPILRALNARNSAKVHDESATQCGYPVSSHSASSKRLTTEPVDNHRDCMTSATASMSSSVTVG